MYFKQGKYLSTFQQITHADCVRKKIMTSQIDMYFHFSCKIEIFILIYEG